MTQQELSRWAEYFWDLVGEEEPFPRSLERPVSKTLPLAIIKMPRLTVGQVHQWLRQRGICRSFFHDDRALRACLLADRGRGLIFLEGSDPADEQRFSLAHELAHFLLDYLAPRGRAKDVLGNRGVQIFDGIESAKPEEQLTAIFRNVPLRPLTHLMYRGEKGEIRSLRVLDSESCASQLALELLAPREYILSDITRLRPETGSWTELAEIAANHLTGRFGLPAPTARIYAQHLICVIRSGQSFREWLFGNKIGKS